MTAPKAAASLSSGLLARRGMARPAMRRQPMLLNDAPSPLEDLGWNDMGEEAIPAPVAAVPQPEPAPDSSPVARHIATIAAELAVPAPAAPVATAPAASPLIGLSGRKAAFTLRLDAERHLRLRLLSAVEHRSAQQLLIAALDTLIAAHPHIEELAADSKVRANLPTTDMD